MAATTQYEMTQADEKELLAAMKPTPVMFLSGGQPMFRSQQENANDAWAALGKKMGFDHMTVRPIPGKGQRFFSAVPNESEAQRAERVAREGEDKKRAEVKRLEGVVADAQAKLAQILAS